MTRRAVTLAFHVPMPPAGLRPNAAKRSEWASIQRAQLKRAYMADVVTAVREALGVEWPAVTFTAAMDLVFVVGSRDRGDLDGLFASFKPATDALCAPRSWRDELPRVGLLYDDSPRWLRPISLDWRRAKKGETPHVEVRITQPEYE